MKKLSQLRFDGHNIEEFLHGYCDLFVAAFIERNPGWSALRYVRKSSGRIVHAFAYREIGGTKFYADARGMYVDRREFFRPYSFKEKEVTLLEATDEDLERCRERMVEKGLTKAIEDLYQYIYGGCSVMEGLTKALAEVLQEQGAALVGVADLRDMPQAEDISKLHDLPEGIRTSWPVGVSFAIPVERHIVQDLKTAPTAEYAEAYRTMNEKLNEIGRAGEAWLRAKGFDAFAVTTDHVKMDLKDWTTPFPHKSVAIRAGLGWIGKNCLLVTPEYGPAIRISSLLTTAPLEVAEPITESKCGGCSLCVQNCPAQALTGVTWKYGMAREEIVDVHACYEKQGEIMRAATGIETDLCGKCFAVCARAQKYLRSEG